APGDHRYLLSFPTRRSSDLERADHEEAIEPERGVDEGGAGERDGGGQHAEQHRGPLAQPLDHGGDEEGLAGGEAEAEGAEGEAEDRKSTRLNSSHVKISYAV